MLAMYVDDSPPVEHVTASLVLPPSRHGQLSCERQNRVMLLTQYTSRRSPTSADPPSSMHASVETQICPVPSQGGGASRAPLHRSALGLGSPPVLLSSCAGHAPK